MRLPLLAALLAVTGCSGPSERQLQDDFAAMHPGCALLSAVPGEGDNQNVYIQFDYKCAENPGRSEALYQLKDGEWVLNRAESQPRMGDSVGS